MLPNEVFALGCLAWYEEQGLIVDKRNGEFAHCPYPKGMGETGYYLLHNHHQQQGLLQSKDTDQCCFFLGYAKKWLLECEFFPENYFELWDIYEKYSNEHRNKNKEKVNFEKDESGKSLNAVKRGKASAEKLHSRKDEFGRSVQGVENGKRMNSVLHAKKDEFGRSITAMRTNTQVWESTVDGFRSTAGPVALHNKSNGWDPAARVRIS
jgi:hypothetical protein